MHRDIDLLALHTVGGRLTDQPTSALERRKYRDPADSVQFESERRENNKGTKEIESILRHDLDNWLRWGRLRDWKPVGFKVPLGMLFKSTDVHEVSYRAPKIDEIGAAGFERIVVSLPERHRQAFVVYHLEKAVLQGRIVRIGGRHDGAKLLGVQLCQYHRIVNQSHLMILRQCQHQGKYIS